MIEQVKKTIHKYGISFRQSNVMVCVSGGADSMALLHLLYTHKAELGVAGLYACHFNHGLRGAESDAEQALVEEYCARLGVGLSVGYGKMGECAPPAGEGTESWARKLRYAFFEDSLAQPGDWIATAHNANDRAETLLFNFARGSSLRGARSILPRSGNVARPLLEVERPAIERYCAQNAVPYATDSSNLSGRFARNRLRANVVPELIAANAGAIEHLGRFCEQAAELYGYVEQQAQQLLAAGKLAQERYSCAAFVGADAVIAKAALALLAERAGVHPNDAMLGEMLAALKRPDWRRQLSEQLFFLVERGGFRFGAQTLERPYCCEFGLGRTRLNDLFWAEVAQIEGPPPTGALKNSKSIYINSIDCDKIIGNLQFRSRRPGDSFTSAARRNTKSLKKLFNEMAVAPARRLRYPVLADEKGVVWVFGAGTSARALPNGATKRAVYIQISEGE